MWWKILLVWLSASALFILSMAIFYAIKARCEYWRFQEFLGDRKPERAFVRLEGKDDFSSGAISLDDRRTFFFREEAAFRRAVAKYGLEPEYICEEAPA